MSYIPEPVTRTDKYLAYIAGNMDVVLPDHPITRKEHYLAAWAEKTGFEDVDVAGEPPLTLENTIGKPLKGLRIYGKSKQVTTTGTQLFPPPNLGSQEKNGITIDCMEDGKIRIRGTAEILTDFYVSRLQLSAGTYTFSAGVNIDASTLRYALVTPGEVPYYDVNGDYTTDMIAETIDVSLLLRVYAGKTIDLTVQPMLNAGSAPLPWEPYTGGKPSPSPDYPQEIESVGQWKTIGVNVHGKNLIPFPYPLLGGAGTKTELNGVTYTVQEDGGVRCIGTPNSVFGVSLSVIRFSDKPLSVGGPTDGKVVLSGGPLYFDPNNKKLFFFFDTKQVGNPIDTVIYPQLELGTVATPYEPYHEPQFASIATPNGLPGIPVSSGGNYTDAYGQQWICDEIDLARGVYVQRIVKEVLNGTEQIKWISQIGDVVRFSIGTKYHAFHNYDADISQKGLNGFFSHGTYYTNYSLNDIHGYADGENLFIFLPIGILENNADSIAAYVNEQYENGSPLTMHYIVATPIEKPLTSDQIAAYKALHTYKGTTIIDNDAGAYMSVKYEKMK